MRVRGAIVEVDSEAEAALMLMGGAGTESFRILESNPTDPSAYHSAMSVCKGEEVVLTVTDVSSIPEVGRYRVEWDTINKENVERKQCDFGIDTIFQ